MPPEFTDPRVPARSDGREVTRVNSLGHAAVQVRWLEREREAGAAVTIAIPPSHAL